LPKIATLSKRWAEKKERKNFLEKKKKIPKIKEFKIKIVFGVILNWGIK
jgi:hypothetical protein